MLDSRGRRRRPRNLMTFATWPHQVDDGNDEGVDGCVVVDGEDGAGWIMRLQCPSILGARSTETNFERR